MQPTQTSAPVLGALQPIGAATDIGLPGVSHLVVAQTPSSARGQGPLVTDTLKKCRWGGRIALAQLGDKLVIAIGGFMEHQQILSLACRNVQRCLGGPDSYQALGGGFFLLEQGGLKFEGKSGFLGSVASDKLKAFAVSQVEIFLRANGVVW